MKDSPDPSSPEPEAPELPGLHTWRAVYWFVIASFILWIVLLTVLTRAFS